MTNKNPRSISAAACSLEKSSFLIHSILFLLYLRTVIFENQLYLPGDFTAVMFVDLIK